MPRYTFCYPISRKHFYTKPLQKFWGSLGNLLYCSFSFFSNKFLGEIWIWRRNFSNTKWRVMNEEETCAYMQVYSESDCEIAGSHLGSVSKHSCFYCNWIHDMVIWSLCLCMRCSKLHHQNFHQAPAQISDLGETAQKWTNHGPYSELRLGKSNGIRFCFGHGLSYIFTYHIYMYIYTIIYDVIWC